MVSRAVSAAQPADTARRAACYYLYMRTTSSWCFRAQVDASTAINNNVVSVTVNFALRDSSGVFDDAYNGFVDILVIVDRI